MKRGLSANQARLAVATVVASVFAAAWAADRRYPAAILSGEASVGTWVSGFLLGGCAILSIAIAFRNGAIPWLPIALFFILLALDERFMFHERLKDYLLFSPPATAARSISRLGGELPVIAVAFAGAAVAYSIWRSVRARNRAYLAVSVILGCVSVALDVAHLQMALEDLCKVLGETCVLFCLLGEME